MTTTAEHRPHVEVVQHHTTSMTLVAEEFEADVRVAAKERGRRRGRRADAARRRRAAAARAGSPGAHVDLILGRRADPAVLAVRRPGRPPLLAAGHPARRRRPRRLALRPRPAAGRRHRARPRPAQQLPARSHSPRYLFIAGGIGITPILTMIAAGRGAPGPTGGWSTAGGGARRWPSSTSSRRYGDRVDGAPAGRDRAARSGVAARAPARPDTTDLLLRPGTAAGRGRSSTARAWPAESLHVERFAAKPVGDRRADRGVRGHLAQAS